MVQDIGNHSPPSYLTLLCLPVARSPARQPPLTIATISISGAMLVVCDLMGPKAEQIAAEKRCASLL
jgi:hypothetical protein